MPKEYDNNMSGVLFRNTDKDPKKNPKWPDYQGSAEVDGIEYWLSAWIKEGRKGKFFSIAFKPKDEANHDQRRHDDDEDIPF